MTLQTLTNPARTVTLPSGRQAQIRSLLVRDWQAALTLYAGFLEALAAAKDRDLTEEDVEREMPSLLIDSLTIGEHADVPEADREPMAAHARANVDRFLGYVCDQDAAALLGMDLADIEALWREVYRHNRAPFARKLSEEARSGKHAAARMIVERVRQETERMLSSFSSSPAPESQPTASEPSPSPSPSPSRKRRRGTSAGSSTPPPTSGP